MTSTSVSTPVAALQGAYQGSNQLLDRNLSGVAEPLAAQRPRPDMNSIIWVVGHIGYWRHEIADAAQVPRPEGFPDVAIFRGIKRGAPKDTGDWSLESVSALCESGLTRMNEGFAAAAAGSTGAGAFLAMAGQLLVHEAYSVGQVAVLRRLAGYEGAI